MTTGIPPRAELRPGTSSGQTDGYRWTIDVRPLGDDWAVPGADVAWIPELVRVRVTISLRRDVGHSHRSPDAEAVRNDAPR